MEAFVQHNWSDEVVDPFLQILTVHLFNRHPPAPKTRAKARNPDPVKSPLGLQVHITDILLEELAKVGAGSLETSHILKMISPFIRELRDNDDERLLNQIKQRIFHHLMKQSDVGIDYVESRGGRLVRVVSYIFLWFLFYCLLGVKLTFVLFRRMEMRRMSRKKKAAKMSKARVPQDPWIHELELWMLFCHNLNLTMKNSFTN